MRPSWDDYFMEILHALQKRATCDRGKTACIFTLNNQILVTGYVGSPPGFPHCDEAGHLFKKAMDEEGNVKLHCVRTIHAEQNAICQAAKRGVSLEGATVYVTMTPCRVCAMMLISIGIKRVVAEYKYHAGQETEEMFAEAGIQLEFIHNETMKY